MRDKDVAIVLLIVLGMAMVPISSAVFADDPPRRLSIVPDDDQPFLFADFERKLSNLRAERSALDTELKSMAKRERINLPSLDRDQLQIQKRLKDALFLLEQRKKQAQARLQHSDGQPKQIEEPNHEPKSKPDHGGAVKDPPKSQGEPSHAVLDPLNLGHALFQVEEYAEALSSLRMVDLKGKKPEERAPIQYLMACCHENLGKYDEAFALLREAGNTRGDEQVASIAQWHLETLRWRRTTLDQLQTLRNRRMVLEKQP